MKKILTLNSRTRLHRVLCSLLLSAAAFWALARNAEAEDIVYINEPYAAGGSVSEYKASGVPIKTDFLTTININGLLVSGDILYVPSANSTSDRDVIATYNAKTGALINFNFFSYPVGANYEPAGMVLSGNNLYVANNLGDSIAKIDITNPNAGNPDFIKNTATNGTLYPYALAINGSVLYVTNNYANSNGNYYISEYDATSGAQLNANFIQIPQGDLYGLAVKDNHLFVSVFAVNGTSRVAKYDATTGALLNNNFATVDEPWGIAIAGNTLFVASYHDEVIYEFDATTGAQLSQSITLTTEPTNIAVRVVKKK